MEPLKHLLDFAGWQPENAHAIFETARLMEEVLARPVKKVPALNGFTVATVFFEPSTRTRSSFELAARRMSADVVSFNAQASSLVKGESYRDTLLTLEAMGIDAYVIRVDASGLVHQATRWVKGAVINAGDGWHAHPTQALLDAYTLISATGGLENKKVAIIGDILHSRVARSNSELLPLLGAQVVAAGPATLLPDSLPGAQLTSDLDEALAGADAVMVLRLQKERMDSGLIPSLAEYRATWQVNSARMALAKPEAPLLHPGPMNRDLELDGTLADSPRSLVTRQVAAGVAIRMSVLYHLLVGRRDGPPR